MMGTDVLSLLIFGGCIALFIWDRLPMATSAILGCAAMVLLGVCDFKTAFGEFSNSTVLMLIGVSIVGSAVAETGMAARIGWGITRFSRNSERTLLIISFVLAALLSTFLTNVTVLAIFIPIIFSLARTETRINPLNIVIPLTVAVNVGGITTLVGSSQQMTAQGMLEEYGYATFGVFDFTLYGVLIGAAALGYILLIGYPLGKRIWGSRVRTSDDHSAAVERKDMSLPKGIAISIIFVVMVLLYITRRIPFTSVSVPPYLTAILAALACIITGCISQKKAIASVNWNIVGRLAACLGLAKALSHAGGIDLVADGFMRIAGAWMSPTLLFVLLTFLAMVLSLFVSNSTAISVAVLVVISIAPQMHLNVPAFAMGITLSASMGASCPLSGSTWGISMSAGYEFRDYFKYGVLLDLLCYAVIAVSVPLTMGLTV